MLIPRSPRTHKGPSASIWRRDARRRSDLSPKDYPFSTHAIGKQRGDVGRLVLEKGAVVNGRVTDEHGKPAAGVWVNATITRGPAKADITQWGDQRSALADEKGLFTLPPLPAGEWSIAADDHPYDSWNHPEVSPASRRGLPWIFLPTKLNLTARAATASLEIRAAPQVIVEGQVYDSRGKPWGGVTDTYLWGTVDSQTINGWAIDAATSFWNGTTIVGENIERIDKIGHFIIRAPRGLKEAKLWIPSGCRVRMAKGAPLSNQSAITLGTLERDIRAIEIIRYDSPTLLVKPMAADGTLLRNAKVGVKYAAGREPSDGPSGYDYARGGFVEERKCWAFAGDLLPDEELTVTVSAPGYEPRSETLKLAEGAVKELEVRLKPAAVRPARADASGTKTGGWFQTKEGDSQAETVSGERPRGNCSISGKVVSEATGEPVSKATMYLFYCVTHGSIFIDTAADGTFVFKDIPKGPFSLLMCNKAGYQNVAYNPEGKPGQFPDFSLKDGERRSGIVLRAKRACRISGKIRDENGNIPQDVASLHVLAWTKRDHGETYESQQTSVKQADGSYSIDGLADKPAYVMVINWQAAREGNADPPIYYPSTFSRSEANLVTFDKSPSQDNINITRRKEGGLTVEGTVRDESGRPVPEAFVVMHHRDMLFDFATAYTDQQGRYRIQGLGDGRFFVHVDAVHRGLVRVRTPLDLDKTKKDTRARLYAAAGSPAFRPVGGPAGQGLADRHEPRLCHGRDTVGEGRDTVGEAGVFPGFQPDQLSQQAPTGRRPPGLRGFFPPWRRPLRFRGHDLSDHQHLHHPGHGGRTHHPRLCARKGKARGRQGPSSAAKTS